ALVPMTSRVAHAVTLFTPVSSASVGQFLSCILTNVGTTPITASARLLDFPTGNDITAATNCPVKPATLAPGASCRAALTAVAGGYCQFDASSSKVRGVLFTGTVGSDSVVALLPATK